MQPELYVDRELGVAGALEAQHRLRPVPELFNKAVERKELRRGVRAGGTDGAGDGAGLSTRGVARALQARRLRRLGSGLADYRLELVGGNSVDVRARRRASRQRHRRIARARNGRAPESSYSKSTRHPHVQNSTDTAT